MSTIRMTRSAGPGSRLDEPVEEYELPDLPITPREGWLTVLSLLVMLVVGAIAIDDARWAGYSVGTHSSQTGFLPLAALASTLLGLVLSRTALSIFRIHLIASLIGGLALPYLVANSISQAPAIEGRLHDLNVSVSTFVEDIFVLGVRSTETSVFLLVLGALIWAAGHFCAVAVFRRGRPLPAIVLSGAIVLLNVSLTVREQYLHVLVFAAAALMLAVRLNVREQALKMRIRGMRDVADISASFMRSGAVFVAVAIVASSMLATNASSAPLARAWTDWDDDILEFGYAINRWLGGVTGAARGPNVLFTPSQTIHDFWQSSSEEVFTARVSDGIGRRWRGATYDSFDGRTWQQLERQVQVIAAGEDLLLQTPEAVTASTGWHEVSVEVLPTDYGGDVFVAPAVPLVLDQAVELTTHGANGAFVLGKLSYGIKSGVPYTVDSLVRSTSGSGALTATQLAAAGTDYPDWIRPYLDIRPGALGDVIYSTAESIRDSLPPSKRDPYHVALAVQDYLFSEGGFEYKTDLRGECAGERPIDCFLSIRKGYCEYFATAMVMMLRALHVPARYVLGYLPGQEQEDGTWRVDRGAAHAWVEAYFPSYGWVEFDPTPGNAENGQAPTRLPTGGPAPSANPDQPVPPAIDEETECFFHPLACEDRHSGGAPPVIPSSGPPNSGALWLLLASSVVVLAVAVAAWAALRRIPSTQPELAYSGIARLATRLGYGPRPAQTTYEYAARLGELVPVARPDLELLATAKVEAVYGRRQAGSLLLMRIATAYRHARMGLLRLIFRRPRLGRGPRSGAPRISTDRR